jgi:tRNA (cmo5U34)-methyltransferase
MIDHGEAVRAAFDQVAPVYDAVRRQLIPQFDDFYRTVLVLLEESFGPHPFRCLDLGCGTGLLSEMVLDRFPTATLIGLDAAEGMIAAASHRLARFGDRARLEVADYADVDVPGPVEAVVSALSIHHLSDESKQALFRRVRQVLPVGGLFVNADQSLAPTLAEEDFYQNRWLAEVRATGIPVAEVEAALHRTTLDRSATMADQLAWLTAAGFVGADVAWKRHRFTVFVGRTV